GRFQVPVDYHRLGNGLKVVLSRDTTAPIVTVAVYYHIGFRNEPKNRTGFAHLFEHMMFQGSSHLGKMELVRLVQENGGSLNGSTRLDFTNYYQVLPSHKLETILWAEADRMRGLDITQENLTNQQGVVKNEVKVNVLNRPYGGFPWLDLPMAAFTNWHNAHNFYGELSDLDAANLEDVQAFFDAYYAPNNAALVVVGDFEPGEALAWVKKYFDDIPAVELAPSPDVSEPRQEEARSGSRVSPMAPRPALAFAYPVPERGSDAFWPMAVIDEILLQGDDSFLYQEIVQKRGLAGSVRGGINHPLGSVLNYEGPALWSASLRHDADTSTEEILGVVDSVIERIRTEPVDAETFDRAIVQLRAWLYGRMTGFGLADTLATLALFDDDPERINRFEEQLLQVTPEKVRETAVEYLRPTARTTFTLEAGATGEKEGA
ncbi:MAG: insulinase family protein, partial [Holophagales bacterium]|nr:insulinase family protein [Holophagales bacterium]